MNKQGFTIAELVVSIFIMVVMTTLVVANMGYARKTNQLTLAAHKMATDIRQAQSFALGLKDHNGALPQGGWGIYVDKNNNEYKIFADLTLPANHKYDDSSEDYSSVKLPVNIIISSIEIDGVSKDYLHLSFEPPDPRVYICVTGIGDCNHGDNKIAKITLSLIEGNCETEGNCRQIALDANILGLIDIEK